MSDISEIRSTYEELTGILEAMPQQGSWFDDDGFSQRANEVIDRVAVVCPDIQNIDSYKIKSDYLAQRGATVNVVPARANLLSLMGRIKGKYELKEPLISGGPTFIQNQQQFQSQSLSAILELQEKIISELPKHSEGTKEKSFLEKLKSALPSVKNFTEIIALVLKIAGELKLDPTIILKLLGL